MLPDNALVTSTSDFVNKLAKAVRAILDRYQPSETAIVLVTSILVGVSTGLGAIAFIWLIDQFQHFFFDIVHAGLIPWLGVFAIVLIPVLGSLISGPLITRFAREAKGHGVPEVMQAIALRGGRIRPQVVVIKALASAACIGSGGSAGREGPIVQIGSALGSVTGQVFHLSVDRIRNLVACGAAAGIAAVFNAPIAGTIFAMEVILGEFTTAYFGNVVIAAVTASIVSRRFLGDTPAFSVPAYAMVSPWELLFYAVLGILAALTAWLVVTSLYWFEDLFDNWKFPDAFKPAVGGVLLGVLAIFLPDTMGAGLEFIEQAITGHLAWGLMAVLIFGKMLATNFTLGSGNSGGVFAPSLFVGAMLGGAYGELVHTAFPAITAAPGAYALVGMAALFAAATHASITAIIIVFEMSGDYRLILPLMFATVISTLLSERLRQGNIYTLKLLRRGIQLRSGRDVDVMQGVFVEEAMARQLETVPLDMNLRDLMAEFSRLNRRALPVVDENGDLYGIVSVSDVDRAIDKGMSITQTTVREIATTDLLVAYPDETIADVLRRLNVRDVGRLPVVARDNPKKLLGVIRRSDILKAYNIALTNRAKIQHRMERIKLRHIDNTEFVEIDVTPDSPCVNKTLAELGRLLPREAVIVSIRRASGQVIIAHGDTRLQPGDRIEAFIQTDCKPQLYECLLGQADSVAPASR
ncbi:MAG: CBS domain-containing protein [Chloroflexi bacterium]|nr:MAG: CBS domain-containing protein [Chloroflexota bacterium]